MPPAPTAIPRAGPATSGISDPPRRHRRASSSLWLQAARDRRVPTRFPERARALSMSSRPCRTRTATLAGVPGAARILPADDAPHRPGRGLPALVPRRRQVRPARDAPDEHLLQRHEPVAGGRRHGGGIHLQPLHGHDWRGGSVHELSAPQFRRHDRAGPDALHDGRLVPADPRELHDFGPAADRRLPTIPTVSDPKAFPLIVSNVIPAIHVFVNGVDPCAPGFACNPNQVDAFTGDTLTAWSYVSGAPDPNPPGIVWSFPGASPGNGSGQNVAFAYGTGGSYTITMDGYGTPYTVSAQITQRSATPLSVNVSASPNPASVNASVNFTCSASGGSGSGYSFSWSGNAFSGSPGTEHQPVLRQRRDVPAQCSVTDSANHAASGAVDLTVQAERRRELHERGLPHHRGRRRFVPEPGLLGRGGRGRDVHPQQRLQQLELELRRRRDRLDADPDAHVLEPGHVLRCR